MYIMFIYSYLYFKTLEGEANAKEESLTQQASIHHAQQEEAKKAAEVTCKQLEDNESLVHKLQQELKDKDKSLQVHMVGGGLRNKDRLLQVQKLCVWLRDKDKSLQVHRVGGGLRNKDRSLQVQKVCVAQR